MQASRRLQSAAARALNGSSGGVLMPPRSTWDIVQSAAMGAASLLWSQEHRTAFAESVQQQIIRPDILGRTDNALMGAGMVLGLFHDLGNLRQHNFNPTEFLEGIKPALEQFHNVDFNVDNRFQEVVEEKNEEQESKEEIKGEEGAEAEAKEEVTDELATQEQRELERKFLLEQASMMAIMSGKDPEPISSKIQKLLEWDWTTSKDELLQRLKPMVTPEYFWRIQSNKTFAYLQSQFHDRVFTFEDESCEINNVALLSARMMVMDRGEQGNDDAKIVDVKEEELRVGEAAERDDKEEEQQKNVSVFAQVEVLYDMKVEGNEIRTVKDPESGKESTEEAEWDCSTFRVAVLEGALIGEEDLQWRLANIRDPWEFPNVQAAQFEYR